MEAEYLCELLEKYQAAVPHLRLETDCYTSAEALTAALAEGARYDLFLLDIIMPGTDGMTLARVLRQTMENPAIIFLTSSPSFAVEAFSVRAVDYLVKPVQRQRLFAALDEVLERLGGQVEGYALIPRPDCDLQVRRSEIISVEVMGHTFCYTLAGNRRIESKVLRISFEEAAKDLLADPRFLRPHRSYLVNLAHVHQLAKDGFIMAGGGKVPVSRLRQAEVKRAWAAYIAGVQSR